MYRIENRHPDYGMPVFLCPSADLYLKISLEKVKADFRLAVYYSRGVEREKGDMRTILEEFEKTVERFPGRTAVADQESSYSWKELRDLAERAGSALAKAGCLRKPVVILLEKSAKALAVLYGVLYGGGFYVFIDKAQPDQRLCKIMRRLSADLVVCDREQKERLAAIGFKGMVLDIGTIFDTETDGKALAGIREQAEEDDPLYAIFTSGSTGEPKGILVSHRAVHDFIGHFTEELGIESDQVIGNQAPFDFDVSVKDIFSSCMTGAKLVLIPRTYFAMPKLLIDYLCEKRITTLIWAVSALCMISQLGGFDYRVPDRLEKVMFSGEVMPIKQLRIWQQALPDTEFINLYGPSEITCNCTYYRLPKGLAEGELPIGKPFGGRRVFLVDENGKLIRNKDQRGEICVSGESLAKGYYNDPERTAQSFVTIDGSRIYKTGDMGYFGTDGLLYFTGRRDFQIKHMGHRIELGELEGAIEDVEGVKRACCIFDNDRSLIYGFYQGSPAEADVRREMKKELPSYMVPNRLRQVSGFKLTAHGKIDRNALFWTVRGKD